MAGRRNRSHFLLAGAAPLVLLLHFWPEVTQWEPFQVKRESHLESACIRYLPGDHRVLTTSSEASFIHGYLLLSLLEVMVVAAVIVIHPFYCLFTFLLSCPLTKNSLVPVPLLYSDGILCI